MSVLRELYFNLDHAASRMAGRTEMQQHAPVTPPLLDYDLRCFFLGAPVSWLFKMTGHRAELMIREGLLEERAKLRAGELPRNQLDAMAGHKYFIYRIAAQMLKLNPSQATSVSQFQTLLTYLQRTLHSTEVTTWLAFRNTDLFEWVTVPSRKLPSQRPLLDSNVFLPTEEEEAVMLERIVSTLQLSRNEYWDRRLDPGFRDDERKRRDRATDAAESETSTPQQYIYSDASCVRETLTRARRVLGLSGCEFYERDP